MTTRKQVDANRRNATKSTGPPTRAGNGQSSRNALKQGLCAEPSKNAGKTVDGKFTRGNRYGRGRPEGSRNKATLAAQTLLDGEAEALTRKVIDLALSGDITALRLCLERLLPPTKGRPVRLNLPDIKTVEDNLRAFSAMLKAMSDAHITPDEASTVGSVLDQNRRALETVEFEERIAALEKMIGEQK